MGDVVPMKRPAAALGLKKNTEAYDPALEDSEPMRAVCIATRYIYIYTHRGGSGVSKRDD